MWQDFANDLDILNRKHVPVTRQCMKLKLANVIAFGYGNVRSSKKIAKILVVRKPY